MNALDCCAGAGGFSLGLQRAGFDVHGVELDSLACETHRSEVGPCDNADLWDYSPRARYELVAGGIPCQSHSNAGKRSGTSDRRGQLYVPFLRIAQEAGARAILIENVLGILWSPSATHGTSIQEICAAVVTAGFTHLTRRVLNSADYGVPQTRQRLFLVAFVDGESLARFRWPEATHSKVEDFRYLPRWVSLRAALGLPAGEPRSGLLPGAKGSTYLLDVDAQSTTIAGKSSADLLDRPSPCVTATEHKSALAFGSQGAITPLLEAIERARFDDVRPATTICTDGRLPGAGHQVSHKENAVRLTVEQIAALQSFPREFVFRGTKTAQYRQIGNAVPPPLAEAVGRSVYAALAGKAVAS